MRQELVALMDTGRHNYEQMMAQADQDKARQDKALADRLAKRRKAAEERLAAKENEIEEELANLDIEQVAEQEKAADAAQLAIEEEKAMATAQA